MGVWLFSRENYAEQSVVLHSAGKANGAQQTLTSRKFTAVWFFATILIKKIICKSEKKYGNQTISIRYYSKGRLMINVISHLLYSSFKGHIN